MNSKRPGISLMLIVVLVSVVLIMGSAMILLNDTSSSMQRAQKENDKAYYLCDATREELELILEKFCEDNEILRASNVQDKTITVIKSNMNTKAIFPNCYLHTLFQDDDTCVVKIEFDNSHYSGGVLQDTDVQLTITYNTGEQEYTILLDGKIEKNGGYSYETVRWGAELH